MDKDKDFIRNYRLEHRESIVKSRREHIQKLQEFETPEKELNEIIRGFIKEDLLDRDYEEYSYELDEVTIEYLCLPDKQGETRQKLRDHITNNRLLEDKQKLQHFADTLGDQGIYLWTFERPKPHQPQPGDVPIGKIV